jgi:hypothetical protein
MFLLNFFDQLRRAHFESSGAACRRIAAELDKKLGQ